MSLVLPGGGKTTTPTTPIKRVAADGTATNARYIGTDAERANTAAADAQRAQQLAAKGNTSLPGLQRIDATITSTADGKGGANTAVEAMRDPVTGQLPRTGVMPSTQPFGPDSNLIGTQINPVTGQRTQNTAGQVDARQTQLNEFGLPEFQPVTDDGEYTDWSNQRLEESLNAVNSMGVDTGKSQALLDEAAQATRDIQNIPDFGNIDPTDTTKAQGLLDQALAQSQAQSIGQFGDVGQAQQFGNVGQAQQFGDVGQAPQIGAVGRAPQIGAVGQAQQFGSVGQAQQFGDVGRIDDAQAQADLNSARGLVGGANLQQFGAVAGPNLGQANQYLGQAASAAQGAPGAINEYGDVATTDPTGAYRALSNAQSIAGGVSGTPFQGVQGPDSARARELLGQGVGEIGNARLNQMRTVEAGTYDPSAEANRARELSMQGLENVMNGPDRQAIALEHMKLLEESLADQRQLGTQDVGRSAAAMGKLGSGMVTTSLGDLALQQERVRQQEQRRLAAEAAGFEMSDNMSMLQGALGAGGQFTQQDIANAGMEMSLRNEDRGERNFEADRDSQAAQLALQRAGGLQNAGMAEYGIEQGDAGFRMAERDAAGAHAARNAGIDLQKAGLIGNLGMQEFGVGQGVTGERMQNRNFQLQQDQAKAQAMLGSAGALTGVSGQAGNLAGQEYNARFNERGFQANQDLNAQQLALQKAGAMQGIGGQSFGMAQAQTGVDMANRDFGFNQAQANVNQENVNRNFGFNQSRANQGDQFVNRDFEFNQGQANLNQDNLNRSFEFNQGQANLAQANQNRNFGFNQAQANQATDFANRDFGFNQAQANQQTDFANRGFAAGQDQAAANLGMQQAGFAGQMAGQQLGMDALGFDQTMANQQLQASLAGQRAGISLDQAGMLGGLAGQQQGLDTANAGVAGDQARMLAQLSGQKFDMGSSLRNEQRIEGDREQGYAMQDLSAQQSILDQLSGLERQQFGQDMTQQEAMRGERGYQQGLEQQGIDNAVRQALLESDLQNTQFNQDAQIMNMLAQYGYNGAGMGGAESQLADFLNQWANGTIGQVGQNTEAGQVPGGIPPIQTSVPPPPQAKMPPFDPNAPGNLPPPPPSGKIVRNGREITYA